MSDRWHMIQVDRFGKEISDLIEREMMHHNADFAAIFAVICGTLEGKALALGNKNASKAFIAGHDAFMEVYYKK